MFGLRFVRHAKYVPLGARENHNTLPLIMKRDTISIIKTLECEKNYLSKDSEKIGKKVDKLKELRDELASTRHETARFFKIGNECQRFITEYAERNGETDFTKISGWYSRHRGMFLTLLHMLWDVRSKAEKLKKSRSNFTSTISLLKNIREKMTFMISLCGLLRLFETQFNDYLSIDEDIPKTIFPYIDTFDMTKIEMDNHVFYDEVGKQYYPIARSFFTFYVALCAGYYDATPIQNQFFKNIVMAGLGMVYQLFPNKKVNKVNEFAKDEIFQKEGMALWNVASSPYIAPFFEVILIPVGTSKKFQIPVSKYLKTDIPEDQRFANHVNEGPEETILQKQHKLKLKKKAWKKMMKEEENEGEEEDEEEEKKESPENEEKSKPVKQEEEEEVNIEVIKIEEKQPLLKEEEPVEEEEKEEEKKKEEERVVEFVKPIGAPELVRDHITGEVSMELFHFFFNRIMTHPLNKNTIDLRILHDFKNVTFPLLNGMLKCSSSFPIIFGLKSSVFSVADIFSSSKSSSEFDGSIILHCHGGGYIAMDSHTHEMYLRRWAKEWRLPIVSVDYTLAPKERYPTQPLECYLAYKFIVNNFKRLFGKDLKRIIVAGDSAGSNLCTVIIMMAIAEGFRVPDGALLNYPTYITAFEACPSRVLALSDPLVSKPFLELVLGLYPPQGYPYKGVDPFLSPIVAPKEILEQFPPVYMTCCTLDPLFDDGVAMAKKLDRYTNGRIHLSVFDAMPHGFLNFCDVLPESKLEIEAQGRWIKWLLEDYLERQPKKTRKKKKNLEVEKSEEEEEEEIGDEEIRTVLPKFEND